MKRHLMFIMSMAILISCDQNTTVEVAGDFTGYEITDIEGSDAQLAVKYNTSNRLVEKGLLVNGYKDGIWVQYTNDKNNLPSRITSYVNGVKNGPDIVLNNRGQIEEYSDFLNNQLHGLYGKYRFGRPSVTTYYKFGQFDGPHTEYFSDGDPQKLVEFKNGKQDGILRYYDEDGNVTLEYTYKNGEKVSGGILSQ